MAREKTPEVVEEPTEEIAPEVVEEREFSQMELMAALKPKAE